MVRAQGIHGDGAPASEYDGGRDIEFTHLHRMSTLVLTLTLLMTVGTVLITGMLGSRYKVP